MAAVVCGCDLVLLSRHADYIHTYMRTELGDFVQGDGNYVQLSRNSLCSQHKVSVEYLCFRVFYRPNQLKGHQSHYRPEVPRGFEEVKVPRLRNNGPGWW